MSYVITNRSMCPVICSLRDGTSFRLPSGKSEKITTANYSDYFNRLASAGEIEVEEIPDPKFVPKKDTKKAKATTSKKKKSK